MERYTIRNEEASSIPLIADPYLHPAENGYAGLAAERLAKLEDLYEQLMARNTPPCRKNPHDEIPAAHGQKAHG